MSLVVIVINLVRIVLVSGYNAVWASASSSLSWPRYAVRRVLPTELVYKINYNTVNKDYQKNQLSKDFGCLRLHQVFKLLTKTQS